MDNLSLPIAFSGLVPPVSEADVASRLRSRSRASAEDRQFRSEGFDTSWALYITRSQAACFQLMGRALCGVRAQDRWLGRTRAAPHPARHRLAQNADAVLDLFRDACSSRLAATGSALGSSTLFDDLFRGACQMRARLECRAHALSASCSCQARASCSSKSAQIWPRRKVGPRATIHSR